MMLHSPVMALVLIALVGALSLGGAGVFSVQVLRHWDLASGARMQIELERRAYLVATVLALVLAVQGAAMVLMVFNADRTAPMLVGAMCAFGSFNASAYGFPALYAKMALFFGAIVWLALHHADMQARDYPLTRRKFGLLLALVPLALADAGLSLAYFTDLQPDTLTSCCGTAFNPGRNGLGADAAALDAHVALWLLGGTLLAAMAWSWGAGRQQGLAIGYGLLSVAVLVVGLVAVVSAVSIYVYEHPHHHCPFCILKKEYDYVGFALYLPLFGGAAAGMASGVLSARIPASLQARLPALARRLRGLSLGGFLVFGALSAFLVWRSGLRM